MKKPYRLVVFDWEGTLGDSFGHVLNTIASQARLMQYGEMDVQTARQYVTLGLVRALNKLFPDLSMYQHEQLLDAVQHELCKAFPKEIIVPGARQVIEKMQRAGLNLAIATNRGPHSLERALQESGLQEFFKVTRAAGQGPAKPSPLLLEDIMNVFAVSASETLMIGDSLMDIEMAVSVGADAIAVDFYHQQTAELKAVGALAVFDDYTKLARYLELPE